MHRSKRVAVPWLVVLVAAASISIALAACGSSSGGSSSSETTGQEETTASEPEGTEAEGTEAEGSTAAGVSPETMKVALEFSGGKEGEADQSQTPIKIGFVNQEGQTFSFLEMKAAAEATVDFANKYLGGIDGHPVELLKCPLTGAEAQQRCAVQMLESKVPVVNLGLSAENPFAFTKTLDGKIPMQIALASNPATYGAKNTYTYYSVPALFYGMAKSAEKFTGGNEKVAIIAGDSEGGKIPTESILIPILEELGVPFNAPVYFPSGTVTAPEMTSTLQSAGATTAGAVVALTAAASECTALFNALKQINPDLPVISSVGCANSKGFEEAIGSGPEGWHVYGGGPLAQIDEPQPEAFKEIMEAGGQDEYIYDGYGTEEMGAMMVILKAANEIGAEGLTPAALSAKFKQVKDPVFMSAPGVDCTEIWEPAEPAVCGTGAVGSVYENGEWSEFEAVSLRKENRHINE